MRPQTAPAKPKYVYQEFPCAMYPSTDLQSRGITRTKEAKSAEEESALAAQGYQRTQAPAPDITPTSTKEEALSKQQAQFDAAWDRKVAELATMQRRAEAAEQKLIEVGNDRDLIAKRLATITEKMAAEKKAAVKPAAATATAQEGSQA